MKQMRTRFLSVLLCVLLLGNLLPIAAFADAEIWIADPTGWTRAEQVVYHTATVSGKTYVLNWGVRGERAVFLTSYALGYYGGAESAPNWASTMMAANAGGTNESDVTASALYTALRNFLKSKQTYETSYNATRDLFKYTDCMVSDSSHISSFYSGIKLNGTWDGGSTWNREHTWPKSKASDKQNEDLMMLRPTSVQENSSRGNIAYGESQGYYHPNIEAGNRFDLRGDVARIMLYCYVRWNNQDYMWGQSGVMESADVMLRWMEEDPVDTWEMGRNDSIQSILGVRNCFVDFPELAWALFSREIPANGHLAPQDHVHVPGEAVKENDVPASCTTAGSYDMVVYCTECGQELSRESTTVDALGHAWDDGVVTVEPKYQTPGEMTYTCTRCSETRTEEIARLANPFEDVHDEDFFFNPVLWALDETVTGGVDETHFAPERTVMRADAMVFFWAANKRPAFTDTSKTFKDVKSKHWAYDAVMWAVENGITGGTDAAGNYFSPQRTCTRSEILQFLYAAMGKPEYTIENPYSDVKTKHWYYDGAIWAYEKGLEKGENGKFQAKTPCTRGYVVTYLYRFLTGQELAQ